MYRNGRGMYSDLAVPVRCLCMYRDGRCIIVFTEIDGARNDDFNTIFKA